MKKRLRRTKEEVQKILMQYPKSGLSKTQFCKQFKLSQSALYKWVKINNQQMEKYFVPVAIKRKDEEDFLKTEFTNATNCHESICGEIKIVFPTGILIKIPNVVDHKWISQFIKELI